MCPPSSPATTDHTQLKLNSKRGRKALLKSISATYLLQTLIRLTKSLAIKKKRLQSPSSPPTNLLVLPLVVAKRGIGVYYFIPTNLSALHLSANAVHAVLVLWPHIAAWLLLDYHRSALHLASTKAPRQIPDPW